MFWKSLMFELFEDCYNFSRFYGRFAAFAILKDFSFSQKPKFSLKLPNPKIWTFWETLLFPSHCTANLLPSAIFENYKVFFGKPIFFCKKHSFWTFWEISLFRSHSTSNWLTVSVAVDLKLAKLSCFQKFRFLFWKNHIFFQNPIFRVILLIQSISRQVCYL